MHELFSYKGFTLSYRIYGNGPENVLAFHGFGVTGEMFKDFAASLSPMYRMICVDVVHHGFSSLPEDRSYTEPITYEELSDMHHALLDQLDIDKAWFAGYSMGGRLALGMVRHAVDRCLGVLLFAPDGLIHRPWYRGLAHNRLGYRLYDHWVNSPTLFDTITKGALKLKLIDERLYTFLLDHSSTYDRRALVRSIWFSLRKIEPELEIIADHIVKADLKLWLFIGKHDAIIRPEHSIRLRNILGDRCHYHELQTGHAMIFGRTGGKVLGILQKERGRSPLI